MKQWIHIFLAGIAMIVCGLGMAYYEFYQWLGNPTFTLAYHILQLWWMLIAIFTIYSFRLVKYDTVYRFWGELIALIGTGVFGYVLGRAIFYC